MFHSHRRARLVACLLLLAAPAATLAQEASEAATTEVQWRGPLHIRSQFPLDLPLLDMVPDDASILGAGDIAIEVSMVRTNTFELTTGYDQAAADFALGNPTDGFEFDVDAETTRMLLRADFGVCKRLQLGFEVPYLWHSGAFMDSPIEGLHETFGLPNNDRDDRPQDVVNVDVFSGSGRLLLADSDSALGDIVLRAKIGLLDGERADIAMQLSAKAPTGEEEALAGSGEWDYGVDFLFSGGGRRHVLHGGIGYQFLGQPEHYPFEVDDRITAFLTWEIRFSRAWSGEVQLMGATSILPDDPEQDADQPRLDIAVGGLYGRGPWQLSFGFVENITTGDNVIDFGLFLASRWKI